VLVCISDTAIELHLTVLVYATKCFLDIIIIILSYRSFSYKIRIDFFRSIVFMMIVYMYILYTIIDP